MGKRRVLTGIKPSGDLHIGNYFGAIKPLLDLQKDSANELFVFVANYHAQTTLKDKRELEQNTINILKIYLASGLDPQKTTIYFQSDVPEVHELAWFFATLTTMPELMRAHAFKDAEAKNKDINVATFEYPLLMAADIALFKAELVPVGKDQIQHIEMTREMIRDFNKTYGEFFTEPKELVHEDLETIPGIDGQKMSKSYKNVIPLVSRDDEWRRAVFSIKTGSEALGEPLDPESCNVFVLHKLLSQARLAELEQRYKEGTIGYKESKEILLESLKRQFGELRDNFYSISDQEALDMIKEGRIRAQKIAKENMSKLRALAGVL